MPKECQICRISLFRAINMKHCSTYARNILIENTIPLSVYLPLLFTSEDT
jgi:hypothetical protein